MPQAVAAALKKAGIRIAGQDVGGTHGRRVDFDCASGEMIDPVRRPAGAVTLLKPFAHR